MRVEREDAVKAAHAAAEHAVALVAARRDLERAIEGVRIARRARSGVDVADAAWRGAKARLIQLETGELPSWAPDDRERVLGDEADSEPGEEQPNRPDRAGVVSTLPEGGLLAADAYRPH